jgi:N-acetylmuramoyl-L-alanine amidase
MMISNSNALKRIEGLGGALFLLLLFLSVPGLAQDQDEPYQVEKAGTRRIHCMGQSWKIPVYNTSGSDVVMIRGDHPVLFQIARALGKELRWSPPDTTMYGEDGVRIALGQTAMPVHGRIKQLELPSQMVNGAVHVPSSALDGLMDCKVTVKPGATGAIYVEPILEHLSFAESTPNSTELIAKTSVPVRKKVFTLSRPSRTVIDLVGVALPEEFESIEHPILGEIRVGQFQSAPSIARIVLPTDSGIKVKKKRSMDLFEHQLSVKWPSSVKPMAEREGSPARVATVKIKPTSMPDRREPVVAIRPVATPASKPQAPTQSKSKNTRPQLESAQWVGNRLKLTFSEPVEYRWSRVGVGTKRFVVDFPGVIFPRKKQSLDSSVPGLQGIRLVQNMPEPQPIVRLVCDLDSPIAVDTEPEDEKLLYLEFPGRKVSSGEMPRGMGHTSQKLAQGSTGGRTICLDAGHGGSDPGALNRAVGVNEKTVTLDITMRLAKYLKAQGWNVILTRSSDRDVSWAGSSAKQELGARARMANNYGADLFVSVHANASVKPSIQGSSIHWYKSADYRLAQLIETGVMGGTGRKNRGLIKNRFYVLAHTTMPAVLIETAFLTNSTEGRLLADPNYRDRIARGIASGLQVYASRTFPIASAKK